MRRATWMVCLGALSACGSGSATGTTTPQPSDAAQTARSFTEQIGATTTPGPGTDITAIDLGQVVSITLTPTTKSVSFAAQVQLQPGQQHFSWRLKPTSVGTAQSNAKIALEVADDETSIVEFLHEQGLATTDDDAASWLADNCRLPRLDGKLRRDLGWNCEPTSFLTGSPRSVDYQPGFHPRVVTVIVSAFYPPNAITDNETLHYDLKIDSDKVSADQTDDEWPVVDLACLPGGDPKCTDDGTLDR